MTVTSFMSTSPDEFELNNANDQIETELRARLGGPTRSIGEANPKDRPAPVDRNPSPQQWGRLVEHLQSAAQKSREAEERNRQREDETQNLLDSARKKLDEAAERVRTADKRASDAEAQVAVTIAKVEERLREAEAMIATAEENAHHAEEMARTTEGWLQRVQHTIMTEFADMPTAPAAPPSPRTVQNTRRLGQRE